MPPLNPPALPLAIAILYHVDPHSVGGSTPYYKCMLPSSHKLVGSHKFVGPTSCERRETYTRNRVYFLQLVE